MKNLLAVVATALWAVSLVSCETPPTPEQVNAWANVGHTVIHGALQDAKDVQSTTKNW